MELDEEVVEKTGTNPVTDVQGKNGTEGGNTEVCTGTVSGGNSAGSTRNQELVSPGGASAQCIWGDQKEMEAGPYGEREY